MTETEPRNVETVYCEKQELVFCISDLLLGEVTNKKTCKLTCIYFCTAVHLYSMQSVMPLQYRYRLDRQY